MSFSFGAPRTTAAPTAPTFGATTTGFGGASSFGAPAGAAPTFGGNTAIPAFGTAAPKNPAFGAQAAAAPTFGSVPATSPAFGGVSTTAQGFGAPAAAVPAFGATAGTTPAFGGPSATPAFGGTTTPAFGSTATPTFGSTTTPAFGNTTTPAFGSTTTPAFGSTTTPAFGSTTPGFGLGGTSTATVAPTLPFGSVQATTAPPAFGSQPVAAATVAPALTFGTGAGIGGLTSVAAPALATSAAPNLSFAASTTTPLFGAVATTAAPATATVAPTLNFGAGGGIGGTAPAAAAAPTFSFGGGAATTTAAPTLGLGGGIGSFSFGKPAGAVPTTTTVASLNFGTTTTTATAAPFTGIGGTAPIGGGIFGKPLTGLSSSASLTTPSTTLTAAVPFVGLGGVDVSASQPKPGDAKLDTIKVKETQVPDEIAKTVNALKQYIKEQKTISSDIGRTSTSKFTNVSSEIANMQWSLQEIANSVEANYEHIKQLRTETSKAIQSVEMAQRTQDTPSGLQFENNAPFQYFECLVARYEQDLTAFRQQIMMTERHMQALANPQNISPEELKRGFKQINEAFISIAGRLHEIHQKVEEQKDHYLNLRRYRLRDPTNVFEKLDTSPTARGKAEPLRITAGPTPFSNISAMNTLGKSFNSASANVSSSSAATAK